MLYTVGLNDPVIQAYDLEINPDAEPEEGQEYEDWPMYRYNSEGLISELTISKNRRWVFAVNELGRVECFESRKSGRLLRLATIELPEGNAITLAITPASDRTYIASDAGKIYRYTIDSEGNMELEAGSTSGPTTPTKALVRSTGEGLYVLDQDGSKVWQYSIQLDGSLAPLTPAQVTVSGGPADGLWNADGSRLFVSCVDSNQVVQFSTLPGGQVQETSRVAGPSKPGVPVLNADETFLYVPSQLGTSEIWRYQVGATLTSQDPPFPTNHWNQGSAVLNPFGYLFVLNVGDRNYSEYAIQSDGSVLFRRTKGLDFNAAKAVWRVNP